MIAQTTFEMLEYVVLVKGHGYLIDNKGKKEIYFV
jgi:hypothetical protein